MTRSDQLLELHKKYHTENICELKETATQPVFGNGNPNSDIVFIGEAPGKKEDETGIPFIGAAGKFLSEMLETIKMTRRAPTDTAQHDFAKSDIYITNIVKYRPPENRDPTPLEKEQCADWLKAELEFIKPKLIIFLGRHSMNHFFPDLKISDAHGKLIQTMLNNFPVHNFLPLYHPAAALYNGGLREELLKDFKKIPGILRKIEK